MTSREDVAKNGVHEAVPLARLEHSDDDIVEVNATNEKTVTFRTPRTLPPFIASHDVPRGIAFALQAVLAYALMLAVM